MDLIKNYKKKTSYKYSINDFVKISMIGEGSHGKVKIKLFQLGLSS
jgi:hypothetical protein